MATKKSEPTLASLNRQIAALQAQADALRKKEVAEVVAKIKDAIAHYGLTAADLGLATVARKSAKPPAAGGRKPANKRHKTVGHVKYRRPAPTYAGRSARLPAKAAHAPGNSSRWC